MVRGPDATSRKVRRYRVQGTGDQAWNIARLQNVGTDCVQKAGHDEEESRRYCRRRSREVEC